MTKRSFRTKGTRANDLLEIVHTKVFGPMNIVARGRFEYYVTFIDDYLRYGYVYRIAKPLINLKNVVRKWRSNWGNP